METFRPIITIEPFEGRAGIASIRHNLYKGSVGDQGQRIALRKAFVELGTSAVLLALLSLGALAGGMGAPGSWALPILACAWIVATGRARPTPLLRPLLLLGVALPVALVAEGGIDFLWAFPGPLLLAAVLAGERLGPSFTRWIARMVVLGAGLRFVLDAVLPIPPAPGQRFAFLLATSLLAGSYLARGGGRIFPLLVFLVGGSSVFDRLDWSLLAFGVLVAMAVGRRMARGIPLFLACAALAWHAAPLHGSLVIPGGAASLLHAGPAILLAFFWFVCEAIATLRRSWKEEPKEIVLSSAAAIGVVAAALWGTDRAFLPSSLYLAALCSALGLAARRQEGGEAFEVVAQGGRRPEKSALVASLALGGAALGGTTVLSRITPTAGLEAGLLLAALAIAFAFRRGFGRLLLGPAVFCGIAFLATRPFSVELAPGTALWWKSASAPVALFSLAAAVAGAAHAVRRPGRIGAAQVAGAVACLWLLGLLALEDAGLPFRGEDLPLQASMGAFSVFLLFLGWAGPSGLGEGEVEGLASRLQSLPAVATACALAATVVAGLS